MIIKNLISKGERELVLGIKKDLYEELKGIDNDKISELSNNCIKYYNKYLSNESVQNVIFSYYGAI